MFVSEIYILFMMKSRGPFICLLSYDYHYPDNFIDYQLEISSNYGTFFNKLSQLSYLRYLCSVDLLVRSILISTIFSKTLNIAFYLQMISKGASLIIKLLIPVPLMVLLVIKWQFKKRLLFNAFKMLTFLPSLTNSLST